MRSPETRPALAFTLCRWTLLLAISGVAAMFVETLSWVRLGLLVLHGVLGLFISLWLVKSLRRLFGQAGALRWQGLALVVTVGSGWACLAGAGRSLGSFAPPLHLALAALTVLILGVEVFRVASPSWRRWGAAFLMLFIVGLAGHLLRARPETAATRPFLPDLLSLADPAVGGEQRASYPSLLMADSGERRVATAEQSCGSTGCHPTTSHEWRSSAHGQAGLSNPWYRAAYLEARRELGARDANWCAGCHSPELLMTGVLAAEAPNWQQLAAADQGVQCTTCHHSELVMPRVGQGALRLLASDLAKLATSSGDLERWLHRLWLRLDPEAHRQAFQVPSVSAEGSSADLCASCHRSWITPELQSAGYETVMDDFGPWQEGSYSGQGINRHWQPPKSQDCVDCHMPRRSEQGSGPSISHRFPGAGLALARYVGDPDQEKAVESSLLRSDVQLDIFAMTAATPLGARLPPKTAFESEAVTAPLDRAEPSVGRGESRRFDVVFGAPGVGHLFPGGKSDLAETWLELEVKDDEGRLLFQSGRPDWGENPGAKPFRFGQAWVNDQEQRVDHHRVWEIRGPIYLERFASHERKIVRFRVDIPMEVGEEIILVARVRYRSVAADFHQWAFAEAGEAPSFEQPTLTLAEATQALRVEAPGQGSVPETVLGPMLAEDVERWYDYGLARSAIQDHATAREIFGPLLQVAPEAAPVHLQIALAVPGLDPTRQHLEGALGADRSSPEVRTTWGGFLVAANEPGAAVEILTPLQEELPRAKDVLRGLADATFALQDFEAAAGWFEALRVIDPLDPAPLIKLSQIYRVLKDLPKADRYEALSKAYQGTPGAFQNGASYARSHPEVASSWNGLHEHLSVEGPVATSTGREVAASQR